MQPVREPRRISKHHRKHLTISLRSVHQQLGIRQLISCLIKGVYRERKHFLLLLRGENENLAHEWIHPKILSIYLDDILGCSDKWPNPRHGNSTIYFWTAIKRLTRAACQAMLMYRDRWPNALRENNLLYNLTRPIINHIYRKHHFTIKLYYPISHYSYTVSIILLSSFTILSSI